MKALIHDVERHAFSKLLLAAFVINQQLQFWKQLLFNKK